MSSIQQERDQFSAPATLAIAPGAVATLEVTFLPVRIGQATTGLVLSIGTDAWVTQLNGIAADPAADNPEDAVEIVAGAGETFYYATDTRWATTSDMEASCGITNGVWLKFTATIDSVVTFIGGPVGEVRDGELLGCASGGWLPYTVLAGTTLYLFTGTGGDPGWLDTFARVQPLAHIVFTVDPKATVDRNGVLTVTGTATNRPDGDVLLTVTARQKSGHGYVIAADGPLAYWLTSDKTAWTLTLRPPAGVFTSGPVQVHVQGMSPSGSQFGETIFEASVKASAGRQRAGS